MNKNKIVTVLKVDLQCFQLHIVLTFTLELNCCSSKVYSLKKIYFIRCLKQDVLAFF